VNDMSEILKNTAQALKLIKYVYIELPDYRGE
jgi:hypothetical protein